MRGPKPKLTIEQVIEIMEKLDCDVPIKVLADEYGIHKTTLIRTIENAKKYGFDLWDRKRDKKKDVEMDSRKHVTARQIAELYGVSEGHVRDRIAMRPGFPSPLMYCKNPKRWLASEVDDYFKLTEREYERKYGRKDTKSSAKSNKS